MMRKFFEGLFVLLLVGFFAGTASAALLGNNAVLLEPVSRGEFVFDTDVSYSTASETLSISGMGTNAEAEWLSLSDAGLESVTYLNIPVRMAYGLTDNLSLQLTLPYASVNIEPKAGTSSSGSGLANVEVEGLINVLDEKERRPSLSALLRIKMGAGKRLSELNTGEAYVGSRSTDITFAGVASKKLGQLTGKLLLGYLLTQPYTENVGTINFDSDITNQIIYSLALFYPFNNRLKVSGELWGAFSLDKEKWSSMFGEIEFDNSMRSSLIFTPLISYKIRDRFTLKGAADIVLSKPAAVTLNMLDMYKGTTYTVGGTYIL